MAVSFPERKKTIQNPFTTIMFMEAVNEEPVFTHFRRGGKCVLRL